MKMLEKINDAIEEAIKPIINKGAAMTAAELEVLTKAVCTIEKIKQIENEEYSGESFNNSFSRISRPVNIDYSNDYDNGNSRERGRSPYTGRYVSRDDGYSTRRYYDGAPYSRNQENGYSGHSIKDRMIDALEKMYDTAQTEHERQTVNDWIRLLENAK